MQMISMTTNHSANVNKKVTNFKGLWGDNKVEPSIEGKKTTKIYHPFKDETPAQIDRVVNKNRVFTAYELENCVDTRDTRIGKEPVHVKVIKALDFSKKEFKDYQENKLGKKVAHKVEKALKEANLTKHLNKLA